MYFVIFVTVYAFIFLHFEAQNVKLVVKVVLLVK